MQTVFSHIIQKRFSQVNEDVATDALAFILNSSEFARNGMTKLLRSIEPNIPDLRFKTQQTEDNIRPDIWGFDQIEPRVFIENKFWAGLTENQPCSYLKKLSEYPQPSILLVVVPDARKHTLWRVLKNRLSEESILIKEIASSENAFSVSTSIGPILALTTWDKLLSVLEVETSEDPAARSNLFQLRALCDSADSDAFLPISSFELTNQRAPAFILQLSSIVQASVDLSITKNILNVFKTLPQADWERIGRYARISNKNGVGIWFGIHFNLWRQHGCTPLWVVFSSTDFGHSVEVKSILDSWAIEKNVFTHFENDEFVVAIDIPTGEEKDLVVISIVDQLKDIADRLSSLDINGK